LPHLERRLLLAGAASAALTATAGFAGGSDAGRLLVPWLLAHSAYLAAVWLVLARKATIRTGWLIAVGVLPRLLFLPCDPALSEDLFRYLWDGRLVVEGVNPFSHAPADPTLARYHDALFERLHHAEVRTIYPPMAQALFGAAARLATEPWAWKATLLALEAVLLLSLASLLRSRGLGPERLLLYFWNPLVVLESFASGHVDVAAATFLLFSLALLEPGGAGRSSEPRVRLAGSFVSALAGIALAAAALVKYMPLLLLPALARRRAFATLAAAALTAALLFLPFAPAGSALWSGLGTYLLHWEFNGALYPWVRSWTGDGATTRLLLAGALGVAVAAATWRARTLTGAALFLLAAWIVVSPTVYPWYLVIPIALLPLHPDRGILVFSGLVALSYAGLGVSRATGVWTLPPFVPWVEYGGWALAALTAAAASAAGRAREAKARGAREHP
jgi:hypothetical protein